MSHPKAPQAHDILLIPPLKPRLVEQLEANKEAGPTGVLQMSVREDGEYAGSRVLDVHDEGARKIYNIARPDDGKRYGPGFSVLPIRPDPGSQSATCFLINTENLNLPNPWTAADWDVLDVRADGEPPDNLRERPDGARDQANEGAQELLVAGPRGKVFHVTLPSGKKAGKVEEIDLQAEVSIWSQLREGLIIGTAIYDERSVPLVNLTSVHVAKGARK